MSLARRRLAELRIALMLLTRLPAGMLREPVPSLAESRWAWPLVGLPVGLLMWAAFTTAAQAGLPPGACALLALTVSALITGAIHEDGLADLADGAGGRDRAHRLEIMRDSRIGTYGVLALILIVSLRGAGMSGTGPGLVAFLALAAASRFFMTLAATLLPPARTDGLGHLAAGAAHWHLPAAGLTVLLLLLPLGWHGAAALAAMAAAAALCALAALRQIGGQTGDVLGAVQQVSETAGWLALLALSGAAAA